MADLGFAVTRIDVSQNMVDICRKNIAGTFHKADMATFEPAKQFEAIGAPDNEVVNLINKAYAAAVGTNQASLDHQGLLLATASRVFTRHGFGDITLTRVDVHCNFPEEDLTTRCEQAAAVLTDFWYKDHPKNADIRDAFQPILREHFADRAFEVGDQAVMLVARPSIQE
ncbi:hypothetical protein HIM_07200 [Hirsutella minnesotensis 3608]|uniref:Methyltransferase domain-containing protein n=1 Tax=Hirsutella minnesotensis 3608 TaxID=1043627 RepID=A0A0F7ZI43_9HYPO|nr:hypothetical protein HIM_07200 [Hirsutella minnesotensis 3608]